MKLRCRPTPDSKSDKQVMQLRTFGIFVSVVLLLLMGCARPPPPSPMPITILLEKFENFPWVAYSPTNYDPDPDSGFMPTEADIKEDLNVLFAAGFRGVVTYGSGGVLAEIPRLAREVGFEGVLMGIWIPGDRLETRLADQAAPHVDGYVVGNEGLFFDRYDFDTLEKAIEDLKGATGKPVTTTEVLSLYFTNDRLITLGDWVFPNVHPYWQDILDPDEAAVWTQETVEELEDRSGDIRVVLKEVGLPSAGAPRVSECQQALYYSRLRDSTVSFVFFEAFDQLWKAEGGVGTHWGLFRSDRSPKMAANFILNGYPPFYIYADFPSSCNNFVPEGFMGCWQGIDVDESDDNAPFSGATSLRITYTPMSECKDKWAGIYWWHPPGSNWCEIRSGYDLEGWTKLTFWARGEKGGELAEFKVGGLDNVNGDDCDTLQPARTTHPLQLSKDWTQYSISLFGKDLSHIAGGFVWVTNSDDETTIYLDEVRFEWAQGR